MKIAIFTNTYWPTVNGVAVSAANLRDGLIKLGNEVCVFAPDSDDLAGKNDQASVYRYPSFEIKQIASYEVALPFSSEIKDFLKSAKFDVVHTEHPIWIGKWGLKYAKKHNLPTVTTVHTQYDLYAKLIPLPQAILQPILKKELNQYLNSVDLVTTPGEGSKKRLLDQGITAPIEVVSNPTDLSSYFKASGEGIHKKLKIEKDEQLLGFVGRLSQEKNIAVLLEAMKQILAKIPSAKLVLIGDGPDAQKLKDMARDISDRIIFLGKIDHREIPQYYASLDAFISASLSEVQPMTFAEAMATGAPIIAFDVAGCNDMVKDGENGILVAPETGADGLAGAAIEFLSDTKKLEAISKQAKKWSERYDLITASKEMVKAYQHAIELHKSKQKL